MERITLIFLVMILALSLGCGSSDPEEPGIILKAGIAFSDTQVKITNKDSFDWDNVRFEVNFDWKMETPKIKAGNVYTVGLGQFTKADGERFNPWTHKPEDFNIWADIPGGKKGSVHFEPKK